MNRDDFVRDAVIAIALVVFSFFVRGFGQLFVGREVAEVGQAPFALVGFALVVYLFVRATLDWVGLWPIESVDE